MQKCDATGFRTENIEPRIDKFVKCISEIVFAAILEKKYLQIPAYSTMYLDISKYLLYSLINITRRLTRINHTSWFMLMPNHCFIK